MLLWLQNGWSVRRLRKDIKDGWEAGCVLVWWISMVPSNCVGIHASGKRDRSSRTQAPVSFRNYGSLPLLNPSNLLPPNRQSLKQTFCVLTHSPSLGNSSLVGQFYFRDGIIHPKHSIICYFRSFTRVINYINSHLNHRNDSLYDSEPLSLNSRWNSHGNCKSHPKIHHHPQLRIDSSLKISLSIAVIFASFGSISVFVYCKRQRFTLKCQRWVALIRTKCCDSVCHWTLDGVILNGFLADLLRQHLRWWERRNANGNDGPGAAKTTNIPLETSVNDAIKVLSVPCHTQAS